MGYGMRGLEYLVKRPRKGVVGYRKSCCISKKSDECELSQLRDELQDQLYVKGASYW